MRTNLFLHFRWLKKHPKRTNAAIPEFRFYREALRKCAKNGEILDGRAMRKHKE